MKKCWLPSTRKTRPIRLFRLGGLITIRDLFTHTSGIGYPAIGTPEANAIYAKAQVTGGVGIKGQTLADAMNRLGTSAAPFSTR